MQKVMANHQMHFPLNPFNKDGFGLKSFMNPKSMLLAYYFASAT
jgi:hypothetical protein